MTQKEINKLAEEVYNNKTTLENIVLDYSIDDAGKVSKRVYELVLAYNMNLKNGGAYKHHNLTLNISVVNRDEEFYIKALYYIKYNCFDLRETDNDYQKTILFDIIKGLPDEYREKITSEIINLIEPDLEKIIASKGTDTGYKNKITAFFRCLCNFDAFSLKKSLELFKVFFSDKNADDLCYVYEYINYFNILNFTEVMDIEKFNNSKVLFSRFKAEEKESRYNNFYYKFYNTFATLINSSDSFIKDALLNNENIFRFIFKKELDHSFTYPNQTVQVSQSIKSQIDRVIPIAKEIFGEEKGNKYIKENLFKSFTKTNVYTLIGAFPFKDYEEYIPDTKAGAEIKNLINLNLDNPSDNDIALIKRLPISEQNRILSNPNTSMDIVIKILGKRFVSQELLSLVKERRPSDYLEFYKLKAKQYLINSMKNEFTELQNMGLIEDVIVDFKIPKGQKDSLKLYLGLR